MWKVIVLIMIISLSSIITLYYTIDYINQFAGSIPNAVVELLPHRSVFVKTTARAVYLLERLDWRLDHSLHSL